MSTILEERQRAAEFGFARAEEMRFLAHRDGVEALAGWAATTIGLAGPEAASYTEALLSEFVAGATDADLLARVREDLRRANKADVVRSAAGVLARATAGRSRAP